MANAGSCKIGFKPRPSKGTGNNLENGFELLNKKIRKIIISKFWNNKVKILNFLSLFLLINRNNEENKTNMFIHNNKLPSWFPHVPDIL